MTARARRSSSSSSSVGLALARALVGGAGHLGVVTVGSGLDLLGHARLDLGRSLAFSCPSPSRERLLRRRRFLPPPLGRLRSSSRATAEGLRAIRIRAPRRTSSASGVWATAAASSATARRRSWPRAAWTSRRAFLPWARPEELTNRPSRRLVSGQRATAYSSWRVAGELGQAPDPGLRLVAAADPALGERLEQDLDARPGAGRAARCRPCRSPRRRGPPRGSARARRAPSA